MKIEINRFIIGKEATIGSLSVNGVFRCYTLEDKVRPKDAPKVYGETAIPTGTYPVIVNLSPKFNKRMPRLLNVPGFDGILIHKGNDAGNTKGCILVGDHVDGPDRISHCQEIFDGLFQEIDHTYSSGESVTITITNQWDEEPFGSLETYEWRA